MKRVMGKVKRTLSILLAVAMVVTCVPQTGLSALAATETPGITEAAETEAAEVKVETPESNSEVADDAEAEDVADEEDSTEVIEEGEEAQTPADDEQAQEPVVDDEAAEDGESEDVAKGLMSVVAGADAVEDPTGDHFTYTPGEVNSEGAYEFTVTAETGYTISKVTYAVTKDGSEGTPVELEAADGKYSIPATAFTDADENTKIKITVTADINKYTVQITKPAQNVTVKYGIGDAEVATEVTGNITEVAHGSVLKLLVEPAAGYVETVVVNDEALDPAADHIYTITVDKNNKVEINVERTSYVITKSVVAAAGSGLAEADIAGVDVTFDTTLADPPAGAATGVVGSIAKDTNLTFSVTGLAATQRANVYYGDGSSQTTQVPLTNGKYTITGEQIKAVSDDITIKVEVRKLGESTITVNGDDNVKAVKVADDAETAITTEGVKADEDSTFSFKVETEKFFKVKDVTVDSGEKVTTTGEGKDTVYSFKVTDAASTVINITTELDEEQCYKLALNINGDQGSATVALALPDGVQNADDEALPGSLVEEDDLVTRNGVVRVTVTADTNYELAAENGVTIETLAGAKIEPVMDTTDNTKVVGYDITLVEGKTVTLKVTTDVRAITTAATVTFDKKAAHMTLDVPEGQTGVTKAADNDNEYTLAANTAKRLKFTITADGPFEPTVKVDNDADNTFAQYCKHEDGTKVYEYDVPAFEFGTAATIEIGENEVKNKLGFSGDVANVDVSVSVNGKALAAEEDGFYLVSQDTIVDIKVTQKDNCTLTSVKYQIGEDEKTVAAKKGVAEFKVTVDRDIAFVINASAGYKAAALMDVTDPENTKKIEAVKGVYNVSYDGKYTVGLLVGATDDRANVVDVQVLDGRNPAEGIKIDKTTATAPSIQLTSAVAGKKLTVKLLVAGADEDAEPVESGVSYTLQVTKEVSKINAPGKANQPTDTTKEYKVTTDGEIDKLAITVTGDAGVISGTPEFNEKGMFEITTGQTVGTANVVISGGDNKSATIEVTTTALISSTTAKPTVALKSASDVALTLTLGAKKIDTPTNGAVWYKVVVTPQEPTEATGKRPTGIKDTPTTEYFRKNGDSQVGSVVVGTTNTLGDGGAWKYDVKVSLIHVKDKSVTIDNTNAAAQIVKIGDADAESLSENKSFATLTPAWESNLKLKKGTTTIYTGQTSVMIATPQFSKPTTYTEINVANITDIAHPAGDALTDFAVNPDGTISVSATKTTAVGKHTIQVVAGAPGLDTMYASRATIVVTVERGINDLGVDVPSYSLYKAVGKTATIKATPIYNDDETGKDKTKQPKTKKVTWDIVSGDTTSEENEKAFNDPTKVTIKNGTVTVAKDYVLKANDADNTFRIKVSVDNGTAAKPKFIGAADAIYSQPITITNEGAVISNVAVVKWSEGKATVVAQPTIANNKVVPTPVDASKIYDGEVVAFTGNIEKTEYTSAEMSALTVPVTNLTFKSSKAKNVDVDRWGGLTVKSPVSGLKLTVTANDGNKSKGELTLNVGYDKALSDNLALAIYKAKSIPNLYDTDETYVDWDAKVYDLYANAATDKDKDVVDVPAYNGSAVSRLAIQVANYNPDGWYEAASKYVNFAVKVKSGGKITGEDEGWSGGKNYKVYYAALDKRDAVIELSYTTNDGAKKTRTYKLTNNDIAGSSIRDSIGAKVVGTLHPAGTEDDQKVTIQLSKLDKLAITPAAGTTYTAKAEIDWSKKNDKNAEALNYFADHLSSDSVVITAEDLSNGTKDLELSFTADEYVEGQKELLYFSQSSYALKVTLYASTTGETEISQAVTKATAATVKVDKVKKFTFKPTASYTIGGKDGYAVLSGKSSIPESDLTLSFDKLLNLADKNGQENQFATCFDLTADGKLKVKTGIDAETALANKDNWTGYVKYTATTDKDYYDNKDQSGYAKITVKVNDKAVVKYTHEPVELVNKKDETAAVQVIINTKEAVHENNKNIAVACAKVDKEGDPFTITVDNGKLKLTMTGESTKAKLTTKVWIVPADSSNIGLFKNDDGSVKDVALDVYKQNATSLSLTVTFKEPTTVEPDPTVVDTVAGAKTEVDKWITAVTGATETPDWLTAEFADKAAAKKAVEDALAEAVKTADSITVEVLDTTENPFNYVAAGTEDGSISGKIKVSNGTEAEDEIISFNFTIPKKTQAPVTPQASDFEEAIKKAVSEATIEEIQYTAGEAGAAGTIDNAEKVKSDISKAITDAGIEGLDAFKVELAEQFTIGKAPEVGTAGEASIVVTVTNNDDDTNKADITITLEIPALTE